MTDVVMNFNLGRSSNRLGNVSDTHAIRVQAPVSQQLQIGTAIMVIRIC